MPTPSFVRRVVRTCLRIGKDDRVTIFTWRHTLDLAEDLAIECARAGAQVHTEFETDEIFYDRLMRSDLEYLGTSNPFGLSLVDIATASIFISGPENPTRLKEIAAERWRKVSRADKSFYDRLFERKVRSAEILLGHVTPQRAETYGFDYQRWKKNVYEALDVRYDDMRKLGKKLRDLLEEAERVHISASNGTNLTFSLGDRPVNIYDGVVDEEDVERGAIFVDLPGGAVQLAPLETSADGPFISNVPEPKTGVLLSDVRLDFKDGKLVAFEGGENIDVEKEMWERGTGDKDRIGSFTLGINPRAGLGFTYNTIALGTATIAVGDNSKRGGKNESDWSFHCTLAEPTVELDGQTIIRHGKLTV